MVRGRSRRFSEPAGEVKSFSLIRGPMKYPRTKHLPWSPGGTSDDKRLASVASLLNRPLVLTEKMDGSNVCLTAENVFARSHAGAPKHPSFDALKAGHAAIRGKIPSYMQVFGEWLFARHSIAYTALKSYFQVFAVRDLRTLRWASWDEVGLWAEELGTVTVPVVSPSKTLGTEAGLEAWTTSEATWALGKDPREGVVVRWADSFMDAEFEQAVAKWVRADHVQTDEHWTTQVVVRNGRQS